MQHTNLRCLPENYNMRYYMYHLLSWPQLLYVQEDYNGNVVGYVLAKMDDEEDAQKSHGHITSLSVLRTHRKLGVATRVMRKTMNEMEQVYDANYCSLHVRRTNDAALHLYQDSLGFRCAEVDEKYYVDDEDAFHMKSYFKGKPNPHAIVGENGVLQRPPKEVAPPAAAAKKTAVVLDELLELLREEEKKGKGKTPAPKGKGSAGKTTAGKHIDPTPAAKGKQ